MPEVTTVPLADNALTTMEAIQNILMLENADDPVLPFLINAASSRVETQTDRRFARKTYTERHTASGQQRLVLNEYPILAVEYVRNLQGDVIDPEAYDFGSTAESGILFKETCWPFRGYASGLANDCNIAARYLEVRYTAGYILPKDADAGYPRTLPYDLEALVWEMVAQEYAARSNGAQGLSAFSISDVSWTFDKQPRQSWLDTISRYRRW